MDTVPCHPLSAQPDTVAVCDDAEDCSEPQCRHATVPGKMTPAATLLDCEADCDAACAQNSTSCLGVFYDGAQCSILPELIVTDTGMHGVSYLRTGPPGTGPLPPNPVANELLSTSDGPVIGIGRRAAATGDLSGLKVDRLLMHLIDTRGLSGVTDRTEKPPILQLNLSNVLAGHAGVCPTSLRLLTPGSSASTSIPHSSCAKGGNITRFTVASPVPWSLVVVEWGLSY